MAMSKRRHDYADKKNKRSQPKKSRKRTSSLFSHVRFAIVTCALIAGFIYVLLHLQKPTASQMPHADVPLVNVNPAESHKVASGRNTPTHSHTKPAAAQPPQFEFYSILTDNANGTEHDAKRIDENDGAAADVQSLPAAPQAIATADSSPFEGAVTQSLDAVGNAGVRDRARAGDGVTKPARILTGGKPDALDKAVDKIVKAEKPTEYWLQIASFKEQDEAKTLRAKLLMLGYEPKILPHKTSFRVVLGPYRDLDKMRTHREALANQGMPGFVRKVEETTTSAA